MTDFEIISEIFKKRDIEFEVETEYVRTVVPTGKSQPRKVVYENGKEEILDWPVTEEKNIKYVKLIVEDGYIGFYTIFNFDENGFLKTIKAFE